VFESVHEKPVLAVVFCERARTREFGGESGPSLSTEKMTLGLAEMQFLAVLWGLYFTCTLQQWRI